MIGSIELPPEPLFTWDEMGRMQRRSEVEVGGVSSTRGLVQVVMDVQFRSDVAVGVAAWYWVARHAEIDAQTVLDVGVGGRTWY